MLIEIEGVGFDNKGSELMIQAIIQKISSVFPNSFFVMRPKKNSPYLKRAQLQAYQKIEIQLYGIRWGSFIGNYLPSRLKKYYGLVAENEIDVVIDASGYSYSDKWGISYTRTAARKYKRMKKYGSKIILLPQAFGPFNDPSFKKYLTTIKNNTDYIFAREDISYNYIIKEIGESDHIFIAPDFTNLVKPSVNERFKDKVNRICIIPNYRMIDKSKGEAGSSYIPFMKSLLHELKERGEDPFILIHEGEADVRLAKQLVKNLEFDVDIVIEDNSLIIKGIISKSKGVISSRFHGLVSALSTAVPSLATGWSHKYQLLFNEYEFDGGMLQVDMPISELKKKLDYLTESDSNQQIRHLLNKKSNEIKIKTENMWVKVINIIKK